MGTVQAAPLSQVPLGQTLLSKGIVSQDQLNIALTEQKRFKAPLGKVLVQLGFVTEATIRDILAVAARAPSEASLVEAVTPSSRNAN